QLAQNLDYLNIGLKEGGRLAYGGNRVEKNAEGQPGYYMMPALFTDTTPGMRINREEIFGPVVSVLRAKNYDEALAWANDTDMGLSSGICTTSLKYASHFKRHAQAGMVMVNLPTAGVDYHVPFGGRKGSSYGPREQGRYAADLNPRYPHALRGIALMIAAVSTFTCLDTTSKYLAQHYPVPAIVWARYVVHMVVMALVLGPRLGAGLLRTTNLRLQLIRGVVL